MDIDEVVETSDVEELEEECRLRAGSLPLGREGRGRGRDMEQINSSPPRKRIKVFHEGSASPPTQRYSVSPAKSLLANHRPQLSQSSLTAFSPSSPLWPSASSRSPSRTSFEGFASPGKQEGGNSPQVDKSQDPLLLRSPTQRPTSLFSTPSRSPLASLPLNKNQRTPDSPVGRCDPSTPEPKTPPYSPSERQRRASVDNPDLWPTTTHTPSLFASPGLHNVENGRSVQPPDLDNDELLLFTPSKPASAQTSSSPITPLTSLSSSPISVHSSPHNVAEPTPSPVSPPDSPPSSMPIIRKPPPLPPPSPPPPPPEDVPMLDMNHIPEESRYSLRKRNVAQLNPYTVENMRYQRALKSNPEAIVKMKALERINHHHSGNHYEPDGETQADVYLDEGVAENEEDASWEASARRRMELRAEKERRRAGRERQQAAAELDKTRYPDILRDLSDSDEEGMGELEKEARRVARRKEKEERAKLKGKQREREHKIHKAKRFPAPVATPSTHSKHRGERSDGDLETDNDAKRAGPSRLPSSQNAEDRALHDYFHGHDDFGSDEDGGAGPSTHSETRKSSVPSSIQGDIFEDFFGDNMDMQQDEWNGAGANIPEDPILRGSSKAPSSVDSDAEQKKPSQGDGAVSDIEFDFPAKKNRWLRPLHTLQRMYPKSMMEDFGKDAEESKKAKRSKRRVRSNVVSDDDDDTGPLLPGQTRVQKAANPKDIKDIKGDSETESDKESEDERNRSPVSAARVVTRCKAYESDPDSDVVEILDSYRPRTAQAVRKDEQFEEAFSSEDEVDDEDIQRIFFPDEKKEKVGHDTRLRNESLIDFMLTRCRYIGGARKTKPQVPRRAENQRTSPSKSSKYKIDITTRGARGHGRERQTLLTFDKPQAAKKSKNHGAAMSRADSSRSINDHLRSSAHRKASSGGAGSGHRTGSTHHPTGSNHRSGPNHASSFKRTSSISYLFMDDDDDEAAAPNPMEEVMAGLPDDPRDKRLSYKEREKARRKRARANGIWSNNTVANQVIISGVGRALTSVTLEQEDVVQQERRFQLALAPKNHTRVQRDHWSKQFKPPPSPVRRIRKGPREQVLGEQDTGPVQRTKSRKTQSTTVDMRVHVLSSGKSFAAATNIGKGWLYELVTVASGDQDPVMPFSVTLCGFSLDPGIGLQPFCEMLPQITESFFEFVTALPDLDQEISNTQWTMLAHVVSQHVSCFLKKGNDQETATLREVVEAQVLHIVERTTELALKVIEIPAMALGWFAVELSVRLAAQKAPRDTASVNKLKTSSASLMNLLLQFDIRKTMESFQKDSNLDGKETSHYAAELWICLIHIYAAGAPKEAAAKPQTHPLWPVLVEVLRSRAEKDISLPFHASEGAWFTIFSLCALSQFSAHGTTLGQPRLTACWDAVIFALKRITLESAPGETNSDIPKRRDMYVAVVVKRCLHLHEKWGWKLHDPSGMFNELVGIFRSRKFANLYQEQGDFPDFFKLADTNLLLSADPNDTTFMVFLKLIVRAAHDDPVYVERKSSPKVKKWLSIAVPVGDVPLPKHMPEAEIQHFLSMFYNRLAAVAVAVELDPTEYDDRTEKARHYIKFATADHTTRFAIMRGMLYWSNMLVARKVKLTAIVGWIEQMATIVASEVKQFSRKSPSPTTEGAEAENETARKCSIFFVNLLFTSVRKIIESHMKAKVYPFPGLIVALKPVMNSWSMTEEGGKKIEQLQTAFGTLGTALFDARALVLPPPSRPPPIAVDNEDSQESQDFGMDDFGELDWDNIDLPEALGGNRDHTAAPETAIDDQLLQQALETVQFRSTVTSFLRPYLQAPPDDTQRKEHEAECDKWIRLFLCCSAVESKDEKWTVCLRRLDLLLPEDKSCQQTIDPWVSRVHLSIMYQLLQLDPMAYMTMEDRAMEVFLLALVSDHVALEKEYVAYFLSISSLRHPLLGGVTDLPPLDVKSGDFKFSAEEFLGVRTLLLKAIFQKVNELIQKQMRGDQQAALDVIHFLELIKKMFSTMRGRLTSLSKTAQKHDPYRDFCHRVYLIWKECPELFINGQLGFWRTWGAGLMYAA